MTTYDRGDRYRSAKPSVEYSDSYNWDFVLNTKEKIRLRIKELLGK